MRMPNSRQISDEQEEIYTEAPMNGSVMIIGPPGTGKTVIAFLRAQALQRRNKLAQVLMYNNVLRKYTENVADAEENSVKPATLVSWVNKWWRSNKIATASEVKGNRYLDCPFAEKDQAKALGAKWDKQKKKWYVTAEVLEKENGGFDQWLCEAGLGKQDFAPPKIKDYHNDWTAMLVAAAMKPDLNDWGHLIIDEAQDFPEEMFSFLRFASDKLEDGSLTIMADENQRLSEDENSTIDQIQKALAIPNNRFYTLKENFRNTLQIAKVASSFYVGLASGKPELPKKQGDVPQLVKASDLDQQIEYIVRILSARAPGEVGVFVQNDYMRKLVFEKLQHKLREQYRVQTWGSKDKRNNPVDDLVFDTSGTLTVLNRHSCKGLEFDFVFIPELQSINIDGSSLDTFKMNMYVMCSRAREALFMLYSSSSGEEVEVVQYLPNKDSNLLEYKNV